MSNEAVLLQILEEIKGLRSDLKGTHADPENAPTSEELTSLRRFFGESLSRVHDFATTNKSHFETGSDSYMRLLEIVTHTGSSVQQANLLFSTFARDERVRAKAKEFMKNVV